MNLNHADKVKRAAKADYAAKAGHGVKVKICGLKTVADVEKANKYLPDYVGFVFADIKRFVTDRQAFEMKQALDGRIMAAGVFVDEPQEHIVKLCRENIIDLVQLHGSEPEEYIRELKQKVGAPVIKAVRVRDAEEVISLMSDEADYMLYDTYKKGEPGGTGERFLFEILEQALEGAERAGRRVKPYFTAGGLTPGNVEEIIRRADCYAVDVSTGVETDGVKDEIKIKEFIERCRRQL